MAENVENIENIEIEEVTEIQPDIMDLGDHQISLIKRYTEMSIEELDLLSNLERQNELARIQSEFSDNINQAFQDKIEATDALKEKYNREFVENPVEQDIISIPIDGSKAQQAIEVSQKIREEESAFSEKLSENQVKINDRLEEARKHIEAVNSKLHDDVSEVLANKAELEKQYNEKEAELDSKIGDEKTALKDLNVSRSNAIGELESKIKSEKARFNSQIEEQEKVKAEIPKPAEGETDPKILETNNNIQNLREQMNLEVGKIEDQKKQEQAKFDEQIKDLNGKIKSMVTEKKETLSPIKNQISQLNKNKTELENLSKTEIQKIDREKELDIKTIKSAIEDVQKESKAAIEAYKKPLGELALEDSEYMNEISLREYMKFAQMNQYRDIWNEKDEDIREVMGEKKAMSIKKKAIKKLGKMNYSELAKVLEGSKTKGETRRSTAIEKIGFKALIPAYVLVMVLVIFIAMLLNFTNPVFVIIAGLTLFGIPGYMYYRHRTEQASKVYKYLELSSKYESLPAVNGYIEKTAMENEANRLHQLGRILLENREKFEKMQNNYQLDLTALEAKHKNTIEDLVTRKDNKISGNADC